MIGGILEGCEACVRLQSLGEELGSLRIELVVGQAEQSTTELGTVVLRGLNGVNDSPMV